MQFVGRESKRTITAGKNSDAKGGKRKRNSEKSEGKVMWRKLIQTCKRYIFDAKWK